MQLIVRQGFEIQAGNRNYQFILNSDSPIDEFLQVLAAVHQYYTNVKAEQDKQNQVVEEPLKEG